MCSESPDVIVYDVLLSEQEITPLMSETFGYGLIDTGCGETLAGLIWTNEYTDSLSTENKKSVKHVTHKNVSFRFGDGKVFPAIDCVELPVFIGSQRATLVVHVVDCIVPLLVSLKSIQKAEGIIDTRNDRAILFGESVPLYMTSSHHYCMPLFQYRQLAPNALRNHVNNVMFSAPSFSAKTCDKQVRKLHKQFAHPIPQKLKKLLKNAGVDDKAVFQAVDRISENCDICKRFKRPPLGPVVTFPLATSFNETVAMDIKVIQGRLVLHMIDHLTRYSSACVLRNKTKESIVKAVLEYWVRIFGSPKFHLTDNGGEFVNSEVIEYAEKFNVVILTTGAESAWSNGLCEKAHESLSLNADKIIRDTGCSLDMAIHWAVAAKNALCNVYGFAPNQLVFGKNINLPSAFSNKLPAQNPACVSKYISQTLQAIHKSREAFIQQESCERLKRALAKQTRTYSDTNFRVGDEVFYKKECDREYHGPGKVIGVDGQRCLIKHGGLYYRVHPCKMLHTSEQSKEKGPVNEEQIVDQPTDERHEAEQHEDEQHESSDDEANDNGVLSDPEFLTPPSTPFQYNPENIPEDPRNDVEANAFNQSVNTPSHPVMDVEYDPDLNDDYLRVPLFKNEKEIENPESDNKPITSEENLPRDPPKRLPRMLACLQNHNKPGTSEVLHATADSGKAVVVPDGPRFSEPKLQEIQKWKDLDAFSEVIDTGQPRISHRWVCTEKTVGSGLHLKARLCARGFEENTYELRKDSPTCQKESLRMVLCILAAKRWQLSSMDIKSAFLQGVPIDRELYMQPPKEANTDKLWLLKKCPYGLVDAGRQWFIRVKEELKRLGAKHMQQDQALFVWHDQNGISGVMVIHVDDFVYGGTEQFKSKVIGQFRKIFSIGSEQTTCMRYIGINVTQDQDGILLSTDKYCSNLTEIDTSQLGRDNKRPLTEKEITKLRQVSGQINWAVTQSRPDCGFDNCVVQNSIKNATVADIIRANKAVRKVKSQSVSLYFPSDFDLNSSRIVTFTDASHANLPDRGSQGAHVSFIIDKNGSYSVIGWKSKKIKRVVNNTLAAECLAAVESSEASIAMGTLLTEMLLPTEPIPISIMCDSKNLVDSIHSSTPVESKRLQIDVGILRCDIEQGSIDEIRWIQNGIQAANCLTKNGGSSTYLLDILRLGKKLKFCFHDGCFR